MLGTSTRWTVVAFALLALSVPAQAGVTQSYTTSGQLSLDATGYSNPTGAMSFLSGSFNISQVPAGATVHKAFVYSADWNNGGAGLDLQFGTSPYLGTGSFQSDAAFLTLYGYRWDVTSYVLNVPMSYNFSVGLDMFLTSQGNQITGASLVVVWNDPGAPQSTVSIVDGALQVGENTPTTPDTENMTFAGLPAGNTDMKLFTVSDDAAGSGEVIKYNSVAVGGPIDENLGLGASLISINNATSVSPANNVTSVTSTADHFGWIYTAVIVPEPATTTLVLFSVPLLAAAAWRRARRRRKSRR